jgi:ubiquitin-conjugating enzyme E2 S
LQPAIMRRVMREIAELQRAPPEGIRISVNEDDMLDLTGIIEGPGMCYVSGLFNRLTISLLMQRALLMPVVISE